MDAEIAVRDLADQQRYNVLPRIVTALGWKQSEHDLHRAPEHERLALLVGDSTFRQRVSTKLTYSLSVSSSGRA